MRVSRGPIVGLRSLVRGRLDVLLLGRAKRANALGRSAYLLASFAGVLLRAGARRAEERVRILFLEQFSELGGGQKALLDTVDAVQQNGWDACVLAPGRGPLVEALQSRHVEMGDIPCGPYHSGHKSALDFLRFARDFGRQVRIVREWIGRASIDLIYVNGPRLLPAATLAARGEVPVVLHI